MSSTQLICPDLPALQLIRTGRRIRLFGRITLIGFLLTIVVMVFVPWQQTARGVGVVVALDPQQRPQPVLSPSEGLISWVKPDIREGSYVTKGEELIRLEPFARDGVNQIDRQIIEIENKKLSAELTLKSSIAARDGQLQAGQQLSESLEEDYKAALEKLTQVETETGIIEAELRNKRNQYEIAKKVIGPGLVSGEELFSKQQEYEAAFSKLTKQESAVKEAGAALLSKEREIASKRYSISVKNQEAEQKVQEFTQKLTSINKELIDLKNKRDSMRLNIEAPRSGFIQAWTGLEGSDVVKKSDQLFIIVPDATDLAFEMRVTGNDMPLVQEGDRVRLQFEGWPAVQFVGWPSVAVGTFGGKVNRVFPTDDGIGYFRVLVQPDKHFPGETEWPDSRYLRQGVRANGWVLLRKVPIGYEIWRQLNGFPPVVSEAEPDKTKAGKGDKIKLPKA